MLWSLSILLAITVVRAWPDGAPCVHAAFESMNPLEAVEHQGGLQLSEPPYEVAVDQQCYWANQPIGLTIQGKNATIKFKGFAIQPFEWKNGRVTGRIGQFIRLDDNGSWQQQCFRKKDSATHSHDEKKKHIKLWWKSDDDSRTVQFIATVVEHIHKFWVKSVVSPPIPPCRIARKTENWVPPFPTPPPSVKAFKLETHRVFGKGGFGVGPLRAPQVEGSVSDESEKTPDFSEITTSTTRAPPPPTTTTTTTTRTTTTTTTTKTTTTTTQTPRPRFELVDGDSRRPRPQPQPRLPTRLQRPQFRPNTFQTAEPATQAPIVTSQPPARFFVPDSFIRQQQEAELQRRRILAQQQEQIRQQLLQRQFQQRQLFQQPAQPNTVGCADFDSRCSVWQQHCQFNAFVAQRCPLTCGFCRFRGQAL